MTKKNPATDKPYRDQISFERKGLHAMIADQAMWDSEGEKTIVQAVHEALRHRYGRIADENKTNPVAMKNRFRGEYDRLRLSFAGSKSGDQFRNAICDLFSRAGRNAVLQKSWREVLPLLRRDTWQHARDLALLALCSYEGKGDAAIAANAKSADETDN
jgi:CRISPR-associated protein Cas8a1/Csx13